jgi:hypothetical protein
MPLNPLQCEMVLFHLSHLVAGQPNTVSIHMKPLSSRQQRGLGNTLQIPRPEQVVVTNSGLENAIGLSLYLPSLRQDKPASTVRRLA